MISLPTILFLISVWLLGLAGCEAVNEGDADGPGFTLGPACLSPDPVADPKDPAGPAKRSAAAESVGLQVLFVSADSLHFTFPLTVNCGLRYAFSASLPDPDTLVIAERVVGGSSAKCVCRKEVTVSLRAEPGQSLDRVKVLRIPSGEYLDFH